MRRDIRQLEKRVGQSVDQSERIGFECASKLHNSYLASATYHIKLYFRVLSQLNSASLKVAFFKTFGLFY